MKLTIAILTLLLCSPFTALAEPNGTTDAPVTPSYHYDLYRSQLPTCFDYREAFNIGNDQLSWHVLFSRIRDEYELQSKEDWAQKWGCSGGLTKELMTLTGVEDSTEWIPALEEMLKSALDGVSSDLVPKDQPWVEIEGTTLEEFMDGQGILNDETSNLLNIPSEFERRGGSDRYLYIGEDGRKNDYLPTSEASYQGGVAIMEFYSNTLDNKFLKAPVDGMKCESTNAAMCCWSRDRQYNDNNGQCGLGNCVNKEPGDNTDLCWVEEGEEVFAYPNEDDERDLHCHGVSWSSIEQEYGDVNNDAKWNSLFYVSMYDHLYKRGYVDSITDADDFMGEQSMCGCVEDMNPVARADCTEAYATANYTMFQDQDTGLLVLDYAQDSFEIKFRSCEGYEYNVDVTPTDYQEAERKNKIGLIRKTNDLSAFIYRQYLEGKAEETVIEEYEKTVVGYRHPEVNNNDAAREVVCQAAFEKKFPDKEWALTVVEEDVEGDEEAQESRIELETYMYTNKKGQRGKYI